MESNEHIMLVKNLYNRIKHDYLGGDDGCIFVDLPDSNKYTRSPILPGGSRPDIYVETLPKSKNEKELIIGEAKTACDIATEHSIRQYKTYFEWCKSFRGKARIVFAVPFCYAPVMRNVVKNKFGFNYNNIIIEIHEF